MMNEWTKSIELFKLDFPIDWKDDILFLETLTGLDLLSILSAIVVMIKYGVKNKVFKNYDKLFCELWPYILILNLHIMNTARQMGIHPSGPIFSLKLKRMKSMPWTTFYLENSVSLCKQLTVNVCEQKIPKS
jgi:hypothetical protein